LLSLQLSSDGPEVMIMVSGELDLSTTHVRTERADHIAHGHAGPLALDMAGVTFLCADGIRALFRAPEMGAPRLQASRFVTRSCCVRAGSSA
jgi:anti-anti-sigma regulatory factor